MEDAVEQKATSLGRNSTRLIWGGLLLAWFVTLCLVPDPRPLGAPEWAVGALRSLVGLTEPGARAIATILLRGVGLGLLGVLAALFLSSTPWRWAMPLVLMAAPVLAVASQWINYGYFPVFFQLQLGIASAVLGALIGLVLRRSRWALVALILLGLGLFIWGSSTGITDDLDVAARATGLYVLDNVQQIPDGDAGFEALVEMAFTYAEDNSHGTDAVLPNQAAILALGVILGEERVAEVAGRSIDLSRLEEFKTLRNRITLRGRNDLARHFWVSAALAILSDENRSMTVGVGKEMMDATPGGSGFSFVDLTADRAGVLFAIAATKSNTSARHIQMQVREGLSSADFCSEIDGLPEGLTRDEFQNEYGGLGGAKTKQILELIQSRLSTCQALQATDGN